MFDVSHMGRFKIYGESAIKYLENLTSNDVSKLKDGIAQYTLLTHPKGGCIDDLLLYRVSLKEFLMVVNASNHQKDLRWLKQHLIQGTEVHDITFETAMIAVQGPEAKNVIHYLTQNNEIFSLPNFGFLQSLIAGLSCLIARSGYTDEDGFEIICRAEDGPKLWQSLLKEKIVPCGLGARDVLRVEAGLLLYGHELSENLSPVAAGLNWVISQTKFFMGSEIIRKAIQEGISYKLCGICLESKRIPAPGMKIFEEGHQIGEVTSGVYSPSLERGIGLAYIDRMIPLETKCSLDIRGKPEPAKITKKRFLKSPLTIENFSNKE